MQEPQKYYIVATFAYNHWQQAGNPEPLGLCDSIEEAEAERQYYIEYSNTSPEYVVVAEVQLPPIPGK